ncbi:trypsin-like serine peptidase [Bdellovibrio reynosensis]|uniref:Serine protease n=1 Tax=Bdellovibrio reynosensis TaxID=2835041 RepID=A0ABY4C9E9_9BACT|nr:serine protease [Bdellovibrio reynosensis]UOF01557.1 serine protease [Bdellovibrio reynosensis]
MKHSLLIFVCFLITSCQPEQHEALINKTPEVDERVIYGEDNRKDLYEVTNPLQKKLADSTVALIKSARITERATTSIITAKTFKENYNLCSSEPFGEQENAGFCSGVLVAKDIIATAGHCMRSLYDCQASKFVFGYALKTKSRQPREISNSEIYSCKEIIYSEILDTGSDFALIRLDRAVLNHAPAAIRRSGTIQTGEPLVVIGHPLGLPTKIAAGARVRTNSPTDFFVANLDTYGGNSGSAVFNATTGVMEGILVRGESDFVERGECIVSNRCKESECRGEDVTRVIRFLRFL